LARTATATVAPMPSNPSANVFPAASQAAWFAACHVPATRTLSNGDGCPAAMQLRPLAVIAFSAPVASMSNLARRVLRDSIWSRRTGLATPSAPVAADGAVQEPRRAAAPLLASEFRKGRRPMRIESSLSMMPPRDRAPAIQSNRWPAMGVPICSSARPE